MRYTAVLQLPQASADPWAFRALPPVARPEWRPPSDLLESGEEWVVKVEVGGLQEEDFEILLYEDRLIIQGYRPWSSTRAEARFHQAEIRHGPFQVEMPLLGAIRRENVAAQYQQGMLCVTLPKMKEDR
ncbi:MAG TPA: Hsp20/alpha crystallin family protein [Myxococcaceae bacterium]|nr:Hsp20/alpha crystallin family protein [Myxococcaceae bacterium]